MCELPLIHNIIDEYERIVVENIPIIDLRSPLEFKAGSFPTACNLPILDDQQRHEVGLCYKKEGKDAAFLRGHQLVSGRVRERCISAWLTQLISYPESVVCCFRGGLRSQIAQQWIEAATGKSINRVAGGSKALRQFLLKKLEPSSVKSKPLLLGGKTGSGKTHVLNSFMNSIDLEGVAHHRGSTFGKYISPQPSQVTFENCLAWELIHHNGKEHKYLLLEDEGRHVGSCYLPLDLATYFSSSAMVHLEIDMEERVDRILQEYVVEGQAQYLEYYGIETAMDHWLKSMLKSIERIRKRLGGVRKKRVRDLLFMAQNQQKSQGVLDKHKEWIEILIHEYYDPMYDYQMTKRNCNIIFRGAEPEVREYLQYLGCH